MNSAPPPDIFVGCMKSVISARSSTKRVLTCVRKTSEYPDSWYQAVIFVANRCRRVSSRVRHRSTKTNGVFVLKHESVSSKSEISLWKPWTAHRGRWIRDEECSKSGDTEFVQY